MTTLPSIRTFGFRATVAVSRVKRVALLLTLMAGAASAQRVRVVDDQRAEMLGILFRIAGAWIPELTGASFDVTRTVFTIGMRLEPGHAYATPFGPAAVHQLA